MFLHEFFDELAPSAVSMLPPIIRHVEHGFDKSLRITGGQVDAKVVGILPRSFPLEVKAGCEGMATAGLGLKRSTKGAVEPFTPRSPARGGQEDEAPAVGQAKVNHRGEYDAHACFGG